MSLHMVVGIVVGCCCCAKSGTGTVVAMTGIWIITEGTVLREAVTEKSGRRKCQVFLDQGKRPQFDTFVGNGWRPDSLFKFRQSRVQQYAFLR